MNVLLRHFKFTDFLLSTYADTLFGTLSPLPPTTHFGLKMRNEWLARARHYALEPKNA